MGLILRALVLLLLIRLVLRFVAAVIRGMRDDPPAPATLASGEMVRDPVCNTFVLKARAVTAQVHGETVYYCSAACRDRAA